MIVINESLSKQSYRGETYYEANVKTKDDVVRELDKVKNNLDDYQGNDIYIKSADGVSCDIFWHEPSLNVNWYPIVQIKYNHKTVFHQEGTENPNYWYKVVSDGISKIKSLR